MRERRLYAYALVFGVVLVLALVTPWLRPALISVDSSLGARLIQIPFSIRGWWDFPSSQTRLKEYEDRLDTALKEQTLMVNLQDENKQLRLLLGLKERSPFPITAANVLSRSSVVLGKLVVIDKGQDDGLAQGQAVVSSEGALIGRIQSVERNRSTVMLVTDPLSKIAGVSSRSKVEGIVSGTSGSSLSFDFVPAGAPLEKSELLLTSGIDEHVPQGLLVGQVREVSVDAQGLLLKTDVSPVFDQLRLMVLGVIVR